MNNKRQTGLVGLTFLYINLPVVLFYAYWLQWYWIFPTVVLFSAYSVYQCYKLGTETLQFTWKELLQLLILSIVLVLVSGISGVGGKSTLDVIHHLQKVYDFSQSSLPIYYDRPAAYASYYFGFYIVPGLVLGFAENINLVMGVWEWLGMFLGLSWMYLLLRRNFFLVGLLFLMSGLLSLFIPLLNGDNILTSPFFYFKDTRWNLLPMYLSLRWVPNQFIYTLIVTGMLLYLPQKKLLYMSTLLLSGLFWTPFPTLVLGCIYLIRVFPSLVSKNKKFLFQFFTVNSFLAAFLVLFLVANQTSTGIEFTLTTTDRWINYLWLIVGEILIFYLLLEPEHRKKKVVRAVMILLLILPLWKLGMGNDLYSRASLPLLMILYIYFLKSLKVASSLQTARWVVLLLVALLPLKYLGDNLRHFSLKPHYTPNTKYDTYDLIERDYQSIEVANQYLMDQHSVFYRYLLDKKIVPQNSPGDQH
jgi:hypothetical protein